MDYQIFFLPLGAFWIYFNCMMTSAKIINEMRDNITSGCQNSKPISLEHRKTILRDWKLMMSGSIVCSFLFAGILIWIALNIRQTAAIVSLIAVAIAPLAGGILFCFCIKPDTQLIKQALEQAEKKESKKFS